MVDVDEFKTINDLYGHAAGDRALSEVARVLSQSIRASDVCARYAGDEFVLVLRGCGGPKPSAARSRFRRCSKPSASRQNPAACSRSRSASARRVSGDGASLETLLVIADRRMYRDKSLRKRARVAVGSDSGGARA